MHSDPGASAQSPEDYGFAFVQRLQPGFRGDLGTHGVREDGDLAKALHTLRRGLCLQQPARNFAALEKHNRGTLKSMC